MISRFVLAGALALCAGAAALADPPPAPSPTPAAPAAPFVVPSALLNNPLVQSAIQTVTGAAMREAGFDPNWSRGRVSFFKRYEMQIETVPNKFREIHLHQGTVINPRGTTIATGMRVMVSGTHQADGSLNANEITVQP
jgi:hypothetical protein